jgi:molybdopterin-dependent oxidoreductase alpha subunit
VPSRKRAKRVETDDQLKVGKPKTWAAGIPSVLHALQHAEREMGTRRGLQTLRAINQKEGFDCPSCAWPDPPERKRAEFCENGAKATAWEADVLRIEPDFWAAHPVSELADCDEYWLGRQGRLVEPVYKPADSDHYAPVSWDQAIDIVARHLRALDSPDEAIFYTSGRTSNEAAFAYQLFVRAFGTNNLPDCSNMCHESTSVALAQTIGVGKASVSYDDIAKADLVIIMGQNPGTNHPRMLTALEEAKRGGTSIVAINPLPEPGLMRFKNPQRVSGVVGRGTPLADQFLQLRLGGDLALLQAVSRRVIEADERVPDSALDREFVDGHTNGFAAFREHLRALSDDDVREATGLRDAEIDELARRYIAADRVIVCWAMGLTQHKHAVATIREIVNLLLLRGNIGRPGAGACPIRGHSNVQGDRTMGIWEKPRPEFIDALEREFAMTFPRDAGADVVESVRLMRDGKAKVFFAVGGNFAAATSDTAATAAALRRTRLTVQVSTKLNRSHTVTGEEALILPTLGRTEVDRQDGGEQFVSVEDTVCRVHASRGTLPPASPALVSEVAIICRLARAVLADSTLPWTEFERDYDTIRDRIARVVPGCADYNQRVRDPDGFVLPHPPRDERRWPTTSGRAEFSVNALEWPHCPPGRLLLQTVRSHDQFNTTIYGLDDRYRGIRRGRRVVFVNPDDLKELGIEDASIVDLHSEWTDGVDRVAPHFRVVAFPTARGCAAAYFPEANTLVPLDSQADLSGTPTSKATVIRLEPCASHARPQ